MNGLTEIKNNLARASVEIKRKIKIVLKEEARKSIKLNFDQEGRPNKWPVKTKSDGRKTLLGKTRKLSTTIAVEIEESENKIIIGSNVLYAKIHNEGWEIYIPAKTRKFRKHHGSEKAYVFAKNKRTKGIIERETKGYILKLPKREFLIIPAEDYPRILNNIQRVVKV